MFRYPAFHISRLSLPKITPSSGKDLGHWYTDGLQDEEATGILDGMSTKSVECQRRMPGRIAGNQNPKSAQSL